MSQKATSRKVWVVSWVMHDINEGDYVWCHDIAFTEKQAAHEFAASMVPYQEGVTVTGVVING